MTLFLKKRNKLALTGIEKKTAPFQGPFELCFNE